MNIGFIGTGHMAASILKALSNNENYKFFINDIDINKANDIKMNISNEVVICNIEEIFINSSFVFLGVKPKDLTQLLNECKDYINDNNILISMVAGFNINEIIKIVGNKKIIRIMPNTPVIISKGITFCTYNNVSSNDRKLFNELMNYTGKLYEIDENKMDVVSVLTGSTPAYLDYFIDSLSEFGKELGFSKEESIDYVLQMALGTVLLNMNSNKTPKQLGDEVCSPGGSTIEGVKVLLDKGLYEIVKEAAYASYKKNKKMY